MFNPNLDEFWTNGKEKDSLLNDYRNRVLYGGRSSSKSHEFAGMVAYASREFKLKVLCTRAFQNRIQDSVKGLIESKIEEFGLSNFFTITKNKIIGMNGSEFLFYGLARNTQEIKSIEGVDICYIEEGQYITKDMWDILEPTIRKEGSEVWISFNPKNRTDFLYKKFILNNEPYSNVRKINYDENPFLSDTMRKVIEAQNDSPDFAHIFLGEVDDNQDDKVINRGDLIKCVVKKQIISLFPQSKSIVGFDPYDGGDDANAVAVMSGPCLVECYEFKEDKGMLDSSSRSVFDLAKKHRATKVIYDSIGVGAGVGGFLRMFAKEINYNLSTLGFDAGAKVSKPKSRYVSYGGAVNITNERYFFNLKAQAWIHLRDKIVFTSRFMESNPTNEDIVNNSSKLFLLSEEIRDLDKLVDELSTPKLLTETEGKIRVEPKKKLKERGIPSHNLADAVVMAVSSDLISKAWA